MARNVLPAAIPREISSRSLKLSTLGARLRCAGAIPPEACRTRYRFVVRWPSALAMPRTVSPALYRRQSSSRSQPRAPSSASATDRRTAWLLRGGRRLVVELLDVAVSLWVVVVRVDHDLARQGLDRDLPVVLERDGDHNDVPSFCGVDSRRRARIRSEFGNERRQGFRPTRVADHNPVAVCRRKSRDLASDLTGADESYGRHASCHPNIDLDRGGVEQYRCQCRSGRELYRVLEEYVVR